MPLLRLLKYAAAALGMYALGWRHGASQTPTVATTGGLQGALGEWRVDCMGQSLI